MPRLDTCRRYSYRAIEMATGSWSSENLLGSGAFGDVYEATDPNQKGVKWAVKRAKLLTQNFKKEVRTDEVLIWSN